MKKIFYLPVLAMLIAACAKESQEPLTGSVDGKEEYVTFEVSVPCVGTKLTDYGNEDTIKSLQVFVFNSRGKVDNYVSVSGTNSLTVTCTKGQKNIYALVNAPSYASIESENYLKGKESDLMENSKESLVMTGKKTVEIDGSPDPVTIAVTRLPARIGIKSITNNIDIPQYKDKIFTVKAVYLVNVVGNARYFDSALISKWYNFKKSDQKTAILYDEVGQVLANKETMSSAHYFYCYPNSTEVDTSKDDATGRFTRLVVETSIGSDTFYYPVSIEKVEANTTYDVSLVVTRPGAVNPDLPIRKGDAKFTISITPWKTTGQIEETI